MQDWPEDVDDLLDRLPLHTRNKVLEELGEEPKPRQRVPARTKFWWALLSVWALVWTALAAFLCILVIFVPVGIVCLIIGCLPLANSIYDYIIRTNTNEEGGE